MSQHDDKLTCDAPGCDALATLECRCSRCERENRINRASEAVHACSDHRGAVDAYHFRMRGRDVEWCHINPGTRPIGSP